MCLYWKKAYTCGHLGGPYVELCRPGCFSNTVCHDITDDDNHRKSYFPCFDCIRKDARVETEAKARADQEAMAKARESRHQANREKQVAEQRFKEERIRREAREKAAREREQEAAVRALKEQEQARAKKEGGVWIETSGGKKGKGKKAGGAASVGFSALPSMKTLIKKENDGGFDMSPKKDGKTIESGGRAGVWGPPKKILNRNENIGVKK